MKSIHVGALVVTAMLLMHPALAVGGLAKGQIEVVLGDGVQRTLSFDAATQPDGSATGQIEFFDPGPVPDQDVDGTGDPRLAPSRRGVTAYAEVNCLIVDGRIAVVGGRVVKAEPDLYVGKQLVLVVEDGDASKAQATWGFHEPRERIFCDTLPFASDLEEEAVSATLQIRP
jgi:hypothetical protein